MGFRPFRNYVAAKAATYSKEELYRNYIADGIKIMSETLAAIKGGSYVSVSYEEILHPKRKDDRDALDIAKDNLSRIGIKVIAK